MKLNLILLFLVLLNSCGDKDENAGLAGLVGTDWTGQFQPLGKGGELGDPANVSFSFFPDASFQTVSLTNVSRTAKGGYKDMPRHKTLLLDIKESNFEEFSLTNTSKALEYSLVDDELVLKDHQGIYTLTRSGQDGTSPTNPWQGSWTCGDDQDGQWGLDFQGANFFGRRLQKGTKALSMSGAATYGKTKDDLELPDIVELSVAQASQELLNGMRFRAEMDVENTVDRFTMQEVLLNGKVKQGSITIKCDRAS